jgi:hypothetical protein
MADGHGSKQLKLTVRSTTNEFADEFNEENKAQKILDEAIRRLNLNPSPPRPYVLVRETPPEKTLALGEKLGDQGVRVEDVIFVQASEAEDG